MAAEHYLFEIETEREGEDAVHGLVARLAGAAQEAGGGLEFAAVTADFDHLFAVAAVPDGAALSAAVLRLALPGVIWFTGPDAVQRRTEPGAGTVRSIAEHAAGAPLPGAAPLAAWTLDGGGVLAAYPVPAEDLRAAAEPARGLARAEDVRGCLD